mgnify:CR=1 FL=1
MSTRDPNTCRRALREIGEIAAVAFLEDSQMTDQEALQAIAAIAEWVSEAAPADGPDCRDAIRRVNALTESVRWESLGDHEALDLFSQVLQILAVARREGGAS